jgi:hypothetical protein
MKNRKLAYILLPAVIAIWGIIFYRIFFAAGGDDGISAGVKEKVEAHTGSSLADTFSIIADYRDPFLGKLVSDVPKTNVPQPVNAQPKKKEPKPQPVQIPWPAVSYSGMIKNQVSARQLAILQVNGQSHVVKSGETVEGMQVCRVWKDSIEIGFGKEKKVFRK